MECAVIVLSLIEE